MTEIDLTKLEYGIDYYGLPPNIVVFLKNKEEILIKVSQNVIFSDDIIINPQYVYPL